VTQQIKDVINTGIPALEVSDELDYEIIDQTMSLKQSGKIIIQAKETSKILKNSFVLTVNPKSING
jgi:hypothetical protein